MSNPRFDIVIFGATGFVGRYAVENLVSTIDQDEKDLTWAVAGRDEQKIQQTLESLSGKIGKDISNADIIVADVADPASLLRMTGQAKVLVNCVGPYARWGDVVVQACVETGTHHLDVSGESHFLEGAYLKYSERAKENKCLIVGGCAYESLPMEMSVCFMKEHFATKKWTLNAVEGFMRLIVGPDGIKLNHGTWDSLVEAVGSPGEVFKMKKKLYKEYFKKKVPEYRHSATHGVLPFRTQHTSGTNFAVYDIDMETSKRTNTHLYQEFNERPVYVAKYMTFQSMIPILKIITAAMISLPFFWCSFTRKLLLNYPSFFTLGLFSKGGPTESQVEGTSFEFILKATGWSRILEEDVTEQPIEKPDVKVWGRVRGPEMTYPATSQCAIQAAVTIVRERNAIEFEGGVFTPGVVFRKTKLIQRLSSRTKNPIVIELIE